MIFIGDAHGKIADLVHLAGASEKQCFQLGDMGLGFKSVHLPRLDNLAFIRGNHDSPDACRKHPNYAGDYGYAPEEQMFYLGGAWSIDAHWRIEGISWWRDEELSLEELHKAAEYYVKSKPRIMATHEAPTKAALTMLADLCIGQSKADPNCPVNVEKDETYAYYKAKVGCANTRTSQVLQQMFDQHQPEHWVFGHYHVDRMFEIDGCTFHCLAELSTKEIVLPALAVSSPAQS